MDNLRRQQRAVPLFCFSPLVMLATWNIEWVLALYVLIGFGKSRRGKLAAITLFLLGLFQMSEYVICTTPPSKTWMLPGLIAITFLPPLGLHIISLISGRPRTAWVGYGLALTFSLVYVFVPTAFGQAVCTGNYVILGIAPSLGMAYGLYYFGLLLVGMWQALLARTALTNPVERNKLLWIAIGYCTFMLPMAIVYALIPHARDGVPSIMCGFALIFAIILAWKIAPSGPKVQ